MRRSYFMTITIFGVTMHKKLYHPTEHTAIKAELKAITEIASVPQCKAPWADPTVQWDFTVLCVFQRNECGVIFWCLRLKTVWIHQAVSVIFATRSNEELELSLVSKNVSFLWQSTVQFRAHPFIFFSSKWPLLELWSSSDPLSSKPSLDNILLTCNWEQNMLSMASALMTVRTQPEKRRCAVEQGILLRMTPSVFEKTKGKLSAQGPDLKRNRSLFGWPVTIAGPPPTSHSDHFLDWSLLKVWFSPVGRAVPTVVWGGCV